MRDVLRLIRYRIPHHKPVFVLFQVCAKVTHTSARGAWQDVDPYLYVALGSPCVCGPPGRFPDGMLRIIPETQTLDWILDNYIFPSSTRCSWSREEAEGRGVRSISIVQQGSYLGVSSQGRFALRRCDDNQLVQTQRTLQGTRDSVTVDSFSINDASEENLFRKLNYCL